MRLIRERGGGTVREVMRGLLQKDLMNQRGAELIEGARELMSGTNELSRR